MSVVMGNASDRPGEKLYRSPIIHFVLQSGMPRHRDFDKFMIIRETAGTTGYFYRLEVRFRTRKPLAIATGPALVDLQSVVRDLKAAMGLSDPAAVAAPLADE
jgi:hypothetical protein